MAETKTDIRLPTATEAAVPIVLTLIILGVQIFYFDDFTPHVPLAIGLAITSCLGIYLGHSWSDIQDGFFRVINVSLPSVSVLIVVGMIIGTWIASGTVPTLIYYGLTLLTPSAFLAAAMILCSVVSVALGTSWGTVGTIGLALMGIGDGFGVPAYWTAGAVVSGAFFGDKVSPLSDTTNLAPAVTGTEVFDHIKNMLPTTLPAMLAALAIYVLAGIYLIGGGETSFDQIDAITRTLQENFWISPVVLLPALVVIGLAISRYPPIPSLFVGVLLGGLTAMVFQGAGLHDVFQYANSGYSLETQVDAINSLLNSGGIQSMMWTISLILIALAFGGALERTGCLQTMIRAMIRRTKTFGGVQSSAIGTSIATNVVAGDPYLAMALPGRMYAPVYRGMGYSTLNLARATEEGGTLMSPLIPWNAGGAFVISALGLGIVSGNFENLLYIPLSFACWLAPIIGVLYAFTGWFSPKATTEEQEKWDREGEEIMDLSDFGFAGQNSAAQSQPAE